MRHKYRELDALRWLAAFAVGMGHAFLCFSVKGVVPEVPYVLGTMICNGAYAVDLFFVLSGFVLINATTSLGVRTYMGFIVRRAIRIYPAAWVSIALSVGALMIAHELRRNNVPWVTPWIDSLLGFPGISVANIVGTLALTNWTINTTLWTIAIELAASVAYPFFVPLIKSRMIFAALSLVAIATVASRYVAGGMALSHVMHYMFMFMAGACLNFIKPIQRTNGRNYAILAGVALMLESRLYGQNHRFVSDIIAVISAVTMIGSIAFWCPSWLEKFLGSRVLGRWGRASYSYYLINPAILLVLVKACQGFDLGGPSNSLEYGVYSLSLGFIAAAVTIPLAQISAEYVEQTAIRVGRTVESRILNGALHSGTAAHT
jgi:peptidoglycan/LPS O-acetylase OafA/YrhL